MTREQGNGGPAFPQRPSNLIDVEGNGPWVGSSGMSLLDYCAVKVLAAFAAAGGYIENGPTMNEDMAEDAYKLAAALIKEREKHL